MEEKKHNKIHFKNSFFSFYYILKFKIYKRNKELKKRKQNSFNWSEKKLSFKNFKNSNSILYVTLLFYFSNKWVNNKIWK